EGAATGDPRDWVTAPLGSFARAQFADLAQVRHHRAVSILDVRRSGEYDAAHIDGAVNIPLHELIDNLHRVPTGEVWVHCASGYRASIAASVLAAHCDPVVAIDDSFDEQAAASGLPVT
ncbi:MAG: rhodanese-like domain-containing protein, partial [Allobranchiibius sp.]